MNSFINYFLEANLYLICFYLIYQILLVRDKHFRFNRAFLVSSLFLSLALPMFSFNIIQSTAQSSTSFEGYIILPAITITTAQTESVGFILEWWHIIGLIYLLGMAFFFSRLFWQITQILKHLPLLNSSRDRKNKYTLVTTNGEIPTCSFFKYLLWDKTVDLYEEEKQQVLAHELVHIRQWHSLDIVLIELLRIVFWINPAIHLIKSRITEVHEYLADHHATQQTGVEKYSKLLTMQIFKSFDFALSNNFHKSQVVKRIRMLNSTKKRSIWINAVLLLPTLSLLITILSCDVTEDILPQSSDRSDMPSLSEGWVMSDMDDIPANLVDIYNQYIHGNPSDKFIIVQNTRPNPLGKPGISGRSWKAYHSIEYDDGMKYIILKQSANIVEEVIFERNHEYAKPDSKIFTIVENQPVPKGGMSKYYEYVQSNLKYPSIAKQMGLEGKVFVQFVVDPNGKITNVQAVKGIGGGCDEEAVRVIKESPIWEPGTQRGTAVNVRMILPITFKLG